MHDIIWRCGGRLMYTSFLPSLTFSWVCEQIRQNSLQAHQRYSPVDLSAPLLHSLNCRVWSLVDPYRQTRHWNCINLPNKAEHVLPIYPNKLLIRATCVLRMAHHYTWRQLHIHQTIALGCPILTWKYPTVCESQICFVSWEFLFWELCFYTSGNSNVLNWILLLEERFCGLWFDDGVWA